MSHYIGRFRALSASALSTPTTWVWILLPTSCYNQLEAKYGVKICTLNDVLRYKITKGLFNLWLTVVKRTFPMNLLSNLVVGNWWNWMDCQIILQRFVAAKHFHSFMRWLNITKIINFLPKNYSTVQFPHDGVSVL